MCRVFGFLSVNPILLDDVLRRPPNAITKQIKLESEGQTYYNVDGYGFTWYSEARAQFNPLSGEIDALIKQCPAGIIDAEARITGGPLLTFVTGPHPAIYKTTTAQPLKDPSFVSFCANVSSTCIFGHMRAAVGSTISIPNCHPFVFGRHSFMYNGGIDRFLLIRKEIVDSIAPGFVSMIEGSNAAEHMAALYMTKLCPEGRQDSLGADEHYSAMEMRDALRKAILTVQEIQEKHEIIEPDNYFNTCATDGESMIGLCYRTKHKPLTLFLSFDAADNLNRKTCYLKHGTVDLPINHGIDHRQASTVLKRGPNNEIIVNDEILKRVIEEERLPGGHGPHVIIASERTTDDSGDWYELSNHEFVMVDTVVKEAAKEPRNIRTISVAVGKFHSKF